MNETTCSICSAISTRMVDILDTNLREIYEKLTDLKVHNESHYLCFICNRRLELCYQLQQLAITKNQMGCYNNIHNTENKYKPDNTLITSKSGLPCTYDYLTEKSTQNVKQELDEELVDVNEFDNFHEQDIKIKYESLDSQSLQSRNTKIFEIEQSSFDQNKYKDSVNKYMCDIYPNEANSDGTLNSHLHAKDINSKLYKCKCCSFVNNKISNVSHKLSHKNSKSYICDICNKTFFQKAHLTVHKRIHTGERPYVCDICNKTFTRSSNLTTHKRIHTGDKPYVCNVCNKAFSRRDNFNRHKHHIYSYK